MITTNKGFTKVIACPDCNGAGEILRDPGFRSLIYEKHTCGTCKGSGRLIRKTTIEYTPFNDDEKIMVRI
jgi:DnaJ-class molecular chaperone